MIYHLEDLEFPEGKGRAKTQIHILFITGGALLCKSYTIQHGSMFH